MVTVLHIVECWSAGVRYAVESAVSATPELTHHLLWDGEDEPIDGMFSSAKRMPPGTARRISAAREMAASVNADLIHAHSSWAGVYARSRGMGVPVVYQPHCYKFDDPELAAPARMAIFGIERLLAGRTASVFVLTDHEEALALRLREGTRTVRVVNAPTVAQIERARANSATNRVVMAGRISPQKDPAFFAATAQAVQVLEPELEFVWIGDGDAELTEMLRSSGVKVTGWLSAELLTDILDTSIYFHSAGYEGFPIAVLDAAARQRPTIVRSIAAFAGSGLISVANADEAATEILRVHRDSHYRELVVDRTAGVLVGADSASRGRRILDAYDATLTGSRASGGMEHPAHDAADRESRS